MSGKDVCDNSKLHLYMYDVKCVNIGSSKDPFLTRVSDFAVLFGNELDAEVCCFNSYLQCGNIHFHSNYILVIGVIDVDGSIYRSNHDYKGIACLQGFNRYHAESG